MKQIFGWIVVLGAILMLSTSGLATAGIITAPTNVRASDGTYSNYVEIKWDAPAIGTPAGYKIYANYVNDPNTAFFVGNAPGTQNFQWHFTNNVSGTPFYYWVRATDVSGFSSPNSASDFGYAQGNPLPPLGTNAYMYNGQMVVDWYLNSGANWYAAVYRSEGLTAGCQGSFKRVPTTGPNGQSYTIYPNSVPGMTYTVSVKTITPAGNSQCSNVATFTVPTQ